MKGSEIVDLVIVKLEEKSSFLTKGNENGPILSAGDNIDELKPVYSYIDAHLGEAADEMLLIAPLNRLVPVNAIDITNAKSLSYANSAVTGVIGSYTLNSKASASQAFGAFNTPIDFLRLYSFKMEQWYRPVHKAVTKSDHLYTLQHNRYTRGTPEKPVVVYSGDRVLYNIYDELGIAYAIFDSTLHITNAFSEIINAFPTYLPKYLADNGYLPSVGSKVFLVDKYGAVRLYTRTADVSNTPAQTATFQNVKVPTLEYYSVIPNTENNHKVEEFLYIPRFRKSLEYNREIAELIALNCAKKVCEVFGNAELAAQFVNEIKFVTDSMKL